MRANVEMHLGIIVQQQVNVFDPDTPAMIETKTSLHRSHATAGSSMCVTKTDGARKGYRFTHKGASLKPDDVAESQGFGRGMTPWRNLGINDNQYGYMVGNAMTFSVVKGLLSLALMWYFLISKRQVHVMNR